ncbi:hypothetical protein BU16DRAFT_256593 [Lophium mytilinum]|uniref:Uncharacterized protein n=1 Tax=Lophium mytilinum TaxID=390894 RepID=A0A6A6R7J4_9PEZI|nr:hypothetical protein BU16DRAFT_256593 [Lophium mytilinum]
MRVHVTRLQVHESDPESTSAAKWACGVERTSVCSNYLFVSTSPLDSRVHCGAGARVEAYLRKKYHLPESALVCISALALVLYATIWRTSMLQDRG